MVTISPPKKIPRATLLEKMKKPAMLLTANKIQLDRVTKLMMRFWISNMPSPL
jgi:hypothetical protein